MRLPVRLFPLAALLLFAGCDASSPGSDAQPFSLELGGALQTAFTGGELETFAAAYVQTAPDGRQDLALVLRARRDEEGREQAALSVRLPLGAEGVELAPGRYTVTLDGRAQADLSYLLDRQPEILSQFRFRGTTLDLVIDRVDEGSLAGRVRLMAEQTEGTRTIRGQREAVTLDGPVRVEAVFEAGFATVVTLENPFADPPRATTAR